MATHSSILACRIPWTEEPGRVPVHGVARVRHDLVTKPPQDLLHNTENIATFDISDTHTHTHTHVGKIKTQRDSQ